MMRTRSLTATARTLAAGQESRWEHVKMNRMTIAAAIACGLMLTGGCQSVDRKSVRSLPSDRDIDAIYARFGDPDHWSTECNLGYLNYYLKNGQTVTFVVGGSGIIRVQVNTHETPNQPLEDTARKLADPQR